MMESNIRKNLLKSLMMVACVGLVITGCSSATEPVATTKPSEKSHDESAKAAAEAEAAEEEFAKTKTAQGRDKRTVASVKAPKKNRKPEDSIYLVQVGTFKVEDNAKKIAEKLKAAGLPAFQKKIERENGVVLYAVRIEPTPNRGEAEKFVSGVKAATGESSLILSVGR